MRNAPQVRPCLEPAKLALDLRKHRLIVGIRVVKAEQFVEQLNLGRRAEPRTADHAEQGQARRSGRRPVGGLQGGETCECSG